MRLPEPYQGTVKSEWIDHNGHMNLAYYVLAFDIASEDFFDCFGMNQPYRDRTGCSTFSGDIHVYYKRELREGEAFVVTAKLLGFDEKRIRYMTQMVRADDGSEVALQEALSLHVDLTKRRVCPMHEPIPARLAAIEEMQGAIEVPPEIGRTIQKPPLYVNRS